MLPVAIDEPVEKSRTAQHRPTAGSQYRSGRERNIPRPKNPRPGMVSPRRIKKVFGVLDIEQKQVGTGIKFRQRGGGMDLWIEHYDFGSCQIVRRL